MTEVRGDPQARRVRVRDLPAPVPRIMIGFGFFALGTGLTMPYLYVYLAQVRGIETVTVGWTFAWMGFLGFLAAPAAGTLIDRFGPRGVMIWALLVEGAGVAALGWVDSVPRAFLVVSVVVVGTVALWPASTALLTRLVAPEARERVYGVNFMILNAGVGIGGLVSSVIIRTDSVATFQLLYALDALTYLVYAVVLLSLPRGTGTRPPEEVGAEGPAEQSWSLVLRDRTLLRVVAISVLAITFGYAQMEAGLAAYAVEVAEVPARALGWAYAANTALIVVGQLVTLRFIEGRRRTAMLALCAGIWSASWLVIALAAVVPGPLAVAAIVIGLGLFGAGETLWAPVAPAVVNDLAPEELRGRYNALQGVTWTIGSIAGPAVAGMLIGHHLAGAWVACVAGGTALAALLFLGLRRHLTDAQDGVAARDGVAAPDGVAGQNGVAASSGAPTADPVNPPRP